MSEETNEDMVHYFREISFKNPVMPGQTKTGLIFVNKDADVKQVNVELFGRDRLKTFDFFFTVQGLKASTLFDVEQEAVEDSLLVTEDELFDHLKSAASGACLTDDFILEFLSDNRLKTFPKQRVVVND